MKTCFVKHVNYIYLRYDICVSFLVALRFPVKRNKLKDTKIQGVYPRIINLLGTPFKI